MNKKTAAANAFWESKREELTRLYCVERMSQADIASHLGLSLYGVQSGMERLGIKPRPRWRSGAENGRFIDGTESRTYRKLVEIRRCAKCAAEDDLLVHHVNNDHMDNTPTNLMVLCRPCHFSHHKTEWWKKQKANASAGAN